MAQIPNIRVAQGETEEPPTLRVGHTSVSCHERSLAKQAQNSPAVLSEVADA